MPELRPEVGYPLALLAMIVVVLACGGTSSASAGSSRVGSEMTRVPTAPLAPSALARAGAGPAGAQVEPAQELGVDRHDDRRDAHQDRSDRRRHYEADGGEDTGR